MLKVGCCTKLFSLLSNHNEKFLMTTITRLQTTLADECVDSPLQNPVFKPKKILILSKLSRLDYERHTHPHLTEEQLRKLLVHRGSDYKRLRLRHDEHQNYLEVIERELRTCGIETRTVKRFDYNKHAISWADAVFSAGGDGTFLLAASKIDSNDKPVIGINTDPIGSEGHLCLLKKVSHDHFADALKRLLNGDFRWLYRQRIRVQLQGDTSELSSFDLLEEQLNLDRRCSKKISKSNDGPSIDRGFLQLEPALNDVFIGESLSSRVSYYEIQCDNGETVKQKSSGVVVCTGSGSTSWYLNINKVTDHCVKDLLQVINEKTSVGLPTDDKDFIAGICDTYNNRLIFEPDCTKLAYCIRNPIYNETFRKYRSHGLVSQVCIRSRCYDAHLVIDGRLAYKFNDGAVATLEIHPEDALKTVVLR